MFFLLLLQSSLAQNLTKYDSFLIDFDPNCTHFLTLFGNNDYIHLNRTKSNFLLIIGRNELTRIYKANYSSELVFAWPEKEINGKKMYLTDSCGEIEEPLLLNVSGIHCKVYGQRLGSLNYEVESSCLTYQCPPDNWKVYVPILLTIIFSFVLAIGGYKTIWPRFRQEVIEIDEDGSDQV